MPVQQKAVTIKTDEERRRELLESQPAGTVIKCITAQVIQSATQGNKIVLQGLHGTDFTPQQLQLVQKQVKQQLLKGDLLKDLINILCYLLYYI